MVAFNASEDSPQTLGENSGEEEFQDDSDNEQEVATPTTSSISWIKKRHYASTFALCLCTFTQSWLLVSVFPYSGFMVIRLVPGTDEENAGTYAGLLAACFMIGRTFTSYGWGRLADIYGRRIVFFVCLVLSAIFSLLFGLSSSFGLALVWRFFQGASNGIAGVAKTVVTETAQGNEKLETRGMSISMGMWAWGFLLSPAISGFLSDPIRQYPGLSIWNSSSSSKDQHGLIYRVLDSNPFLLPNLISVLLCVIDLIAVAMMVPETLPAQDLRSAGNIPRDFSHWLTTKLICSNTNKVRNTDGSTATNTDVTPEILLNDGMIHGEDLTLSESESLVPTSAIELPSTRMWCRREQSSNVTNTVTATEVPDPPEVATLSYLWSKIDTRNHMIVFWIFSFVAIAIDEAFPLFCMSKEGGLGLSEAEIGKLLSATGLIFAITQYHVYAWIVDQYGVRRSIQIGAMLSVPLVVFIPISLLLNISASVRDEQGSNVTTFTWSSFIFLSVLLSFIRIFGLVFFSSITIATNRTVIPSHRGTMNGLCMLGGSFAKGVGPIFAGMLVSFGISSGVFAPKVGAAMVFLVIGIISMIAAGATHYLLIEIKMNNSTTQQTNTEGERERSRHSNGNESESADTAFQLPLLSDTSVPRNSEENTII